MSLLSVKNLCVKYRNGDGSFAVHGMNLCVEPGEIVGIVGESGSGKSSAMLALNGLLPKEAFATADEIRVDEIDITPWESQVAKGAARRERMKAKRNYEKSMSLVRGKKIAMVFQDPTSSLNDSLTVGQQLVETIRTHRSCSVKEAREEALELLDMVGIHDARRKIEQYPSGLSGGMRQRIVIAMALACHPSLLIADEPTTALDVTVQGQILAILQRIARDTGTAVLLVSHDLGVVAGVCHRVVVMKNGIMVETATTNEIFYEPEHPYTKELIRQAQKVQNGSCHEKEQAEKTKDIVLTIEDVSMSYEKEKYFSLKKQKVNEEVKNVSLTIGKGETFGLAGESGCGKTTLAKLITGLLEPKQGTLLCGDEPVIPLSGRKKGERGSRIQMVFQNYYASLNPRMTAGAMLEEIFKLQGMNDHVKRQCCIYELLELTGLPRDAERRYPRELSGGQRQRLAIARALAADPDLIVLDEAVSGLDVSVQAQILDLLKEIQKRKNISYLFISHDMSAIRNVSHKLGIMYRGRLVESGQTRTICKEPWHPYTKELMAAVPVPDPIKARRKKSVIWTEEGRQEVTEGGCPYASRCGYAQARCKKEEPSVYQYGDRKVACFLYEHAHTSRGSEVEMTAQI